MVELCGIEDCTLRGAQAGSSRGQLHLLLDSKRKEGREKRPRVRVKGLRRMKE